MPRLTSAALAVFGCLALAAADVAAAQGTERTYKDARTGLAGKYTVAFPADEAQAKAGTYGALVFFHGSGGGPGYAQFFGALAAAAAPYKLVPIALQAPNGANTWPDAETGPTNHFDDYTQGFLDTEIWAAHPALGRGRVVFVGFSAGSTFVSGDFLPRHGQGLQGGAVMLCGGGMPAHLTPALKVPVTDDFKHGFRLFYHIQQKDFLFGQTMAGYHYWVSRGAMVEIEHPPGGSHCGFEFKTELAHGLEKVVGESYGKPK